MKSTIKFNMNLQSTKRIPWQKVLFESLKRIKNPLIWFLCQHFGMQTLVRVLFFAIQNIWIDFKTSALRLKLRWSAFNMFCWMDYTDFYVTVMDTRYIFCRSHVEYFTPRDVSTVSLLQIKPSAENIIWNEKKNLYTIWTFLNSNLFMVSIQLGEVWNPHENSWEKLLTSNAKRESKIHILLAYWMFGAVKNEHVI